jgi:leader peptidase (prepilin peptidase)/N-methyltransferase
VELLTGVLFYAEFHLVFDGVWGNWKYWGPMLLLLWIFTSLLIAGTFIDFDHFILPHELNLIGMGVGLMGAFWVPQMVQETEHGRGILISFASGCLGLGLLWAVAELGKLALGRLKQSFDKPTPWGISQPDEDQPPVFQYGDEKMGWADVFTRPSDRLIIQCPKLEVNDRKFSDAVAEIKMTTMKVTISSGAEDFDLEKVTHLQGTTTEIVIPREAMGFGDVMLLAMIGTVLGWQAVLFVIVGASVLGTICALVPRFLGKSEWTAKIPFGPYLACAALIWVFYGPQLVTWYLDRVHWHHA